VIRNVTTDINSRFGVHEEEGNSIFIFETAGLCIGHLGHLHHVLTDNHYAEIGRIDILMVPVDGGYTLNLDDMIKVVRRLNASVILPMHWFGGYSLSSFLNRLKGRFPVEYPEGSALDFSLNSLPALPTIYVLQPETSLGQSFE
jgi:L-ascorbate metabolism protein UlaG (beta-lactamase superfamily)